MKKSEVSTMSAATQKVWEGYAKLQELALNGYNNISANSIVAEIEAAMPMADPDVCNYMKVALPQMKHEFGFKFKLIYT